MNIVKKLWKEEEGQTLSEYGLIIGLVAAVVIAAVVTLKAGIDDVFYDIKTKLQDAIK